MNWVRSWQEYTYFTLLNGDVDNVSISDAESPKELDWTEIIKPTNKHIVLLDNHKD